MDIRWLNSLLRLLRSIIFPILVFLILFFIGWFAILCISAFTGNLAPFLDAVTPVINLYSGALHPPDWTRIILQRIIFHTVYGVQHTAGWVLIVLSVLAILFIWVIIRFFNHISYWLWDYSGDIGPIQIDDVKDKPEIAAQLRQHLDICGVKCLSPVDTKAPNDTPGFQKISTAVSISDLPQAKNIALIISLMDFLSNMAGFKKIGHTITPYIPADEAKKEDATKNSNETKQENESKKTKLILEIKKTVNNQLIKTLAIEENDINEALKTGAYKAFWVISNQSRNKRFIPPWYRFPTFNSYNQFRQIGVFAYPQVNQVYQQVSKQAPFNAVLRLKWGDINELNNQYLKALLIYLEAVTMWPFLLVFWYRIANILSSPEEWLKDEYLKGLNNEQRKGLIELLQYRLLDKDFNQNVNPIMVKRIEKVLSDIFLYSYISKVEKKKDFNKQLTTCFYETSIYIWESLENQIQSSLKYWLLALINNFFNSNQVEKTPTLALYHWGMIPWPPFTDGSKFLCLVKLAKISTILQLRIHIKYHDPIVTCFEEWKVESSSQKKSKEKDKPEISPYDDLKTNLDEIMSSPWKNMGLYYNAACFYALMLTDPQLEDRVETNHQAMHFLKLAYKDTQSDLALEWVKNDPDLKSLWDNPQFLALFVPDENKNAQKKLGDQKLHKQYCLHLLTEAADQQMETWKNTPPFIFSPSYLIALIDYKLTLWSAIASLLAKPTDQDLQLTFWQRALQNSQPIDKPEFPNSRKDNEHQDGFSSCNPDLIWNKLESLAKFQVTVWKERQAWAAKLPTGDNAALLNIWNEYKLNDIRQWQQIKKLVVESHTSDGLPPKSNKNVKKYKKQPRLNTPDSYRWSPLRD